MVQSKQCIIWFLKFPLYSESSLHHQQAVRSEHKHTPRTRKTFQSEVFPGRRQSEYYTFGILHFCEIFSADVMLTV